MWSPGQCRLSGHKRVTGWDVKDAQGQDGASTARKGDPIGKFTATFYLVDDPNAEVSDFTLWDDFQALLESSKNGDAPKALDIEHPDLLRNGFHSIVLDTMGEMVPDGKGGASIVVSLMEYKPPKKKKAAGPSGSKPKDDPNDPITKATKDLNDLLGNGKKT